MTITSNGPRRKHLTHGTTAHRQGRVGHPRNVAAINSQNGNRTTYQHRTLIPRDYRFFNVKMSLTGPTAVTTAAGACAANTAATTIHFTGPS